MSRLKGLLLLVLMSCTFACGDPDQVASDLAVSGAADLAAPVDDGVTCPKLPEYDAVRGKPCTVERSCRPPECANPCVECVLINCEDTPGQGKIWNVYALLPCACEDLGPSCFDPMTCAKLPSC